MAQGGDTVGYLIVILWLGKSAARHSLTDDEMYLLAWLMLCVSSASWFSLNSAHMSAEELRPISSPT